MMKRKISLLITGLIVIVMACTVIGCSKKTLESEWDSNKSEIDTMIDGMKQQYADTGILDDIKAYAKENTMIMEFTYSDLLTADMFDDEALNLMGTSLETVLKPTVSTLEDSVGVDDIKIQVIIYLSDGTKLFDQTY